MQKLTHIKLNIWLISLLFILIIGGFLMLLFNLPIELYLQTTLTYHDQDHSYLTVSSNNALKLKVGNQVFLHLGLENYQLKIQKLTFDAPSNQFKIFFLPLNPSWNRYLKNEMTVEATLIYDVVKVEDLFF